MFCTFAAPKLYHMSKRQNIYPTIAVVYDRKNATAKDATAQGLVQVRLSFGGKSTYISTDVRCTRKEWDAKRGRLRGFSVPAERDNAKIEAVVDMLQGFVGALVEKREAFTWEAFQAFRDGLTSTKAESFIDFFAERIEERTDLEEGTRRHHRSVAGFCKREGFFTTYQDLTLREIVRFDDALHAKGLMQQTIGGYHKRVNRYINEAIRLGIYDGRNPYTSFHISLGATTRRKFLEEEEVRTLAAMELEPTLARVRDLFLFQCFTGLSYSDLAKFDFVRDVQHVEGRYEIRDTRKKTEVQYYIVLLRPAVAILERYGWRLPIISNQQYNMRLKAVRAIAGIKTAITTHVARHTFACWALKHGVKIENLSKMLGHTNIKTTQLYAKVLNESVREEYAKLDNVTNFI